MLQSAQALGWAAGFAFTGILVSLYQILCHLRNYTEPVFQRYIIRIIFMVPVYAVGSIASLVWRSHAIYYDTMRDCYESWIIYNFSSLLLAYVGGPGAVVVKAEGKLVHPSWGHMTCCLPTMQVDGFFLRRCKQGTLQFVLLKPVMALLTVILYAAGAYTDGNMSPKNGYFYISILYNVCYTFALYGLLLFWIGATELLQPFNPLLKFILVKSVVFLTFWQGIAISYINSMGEISDPEDGKALQNFMICVEMAMAGICLLYAFPHKEYQIGGSTRSWRISAFLHAISIKDVVVDTIHVFAPSYSDYVLYSDGGPADNVKRKKYRGQQGGANGEHPKSSLIKNMEKGVLADDNENEQLDRRSKTPNEDKAIKKREKHRTQAILLDSDSDGIDSEDEAHQVGTELAAGSDDGGNSEDEAVAAPRHARLTSTDRAGSGTQNESAPASEAASRRTTHQASGKSSGRRSYTRSSQSTVGRNVGATTTESTDAGVVVTRPAGNMRMLCKGPILSDSDSDEELDKSSIAAAPVAAAMGRSGEQQDQPSKPQQRASRTGAVAVSFAEVDREQTGQQSYSSENHNAGGTSDSSGSSSTQPQGVGVQAVAAAAAVMAKKRGAQAAAAVAAAASRAAEAIKPVGAAAPRARPALAPPKPASGYSVVRAASPLWEPAFPGQQQDAQQQSRGAGWADSEQGWSNVKL